MKFIAPFIILLATVAHAETFEVVADIPEVFAVNVGDAQATDYTLTIRAEVGGTTYTRTATASNGEAALIFRNMPTSGERFKVEVSRTDSPTTQTVIFAPSEVFATFDALAQYPSEYLAALNQAATAAGYNATQKQAVAALIKDAMVRLVKAQRAEDVADDQAAIDRRKTLLGLE